MNKIIRVMTVYFDHPEIGFFVLDKTGKIMESEFCFDEIWEGANLDMDSIKVGEKPKVCYNRKENKKLGIEPVYDYLQTPVLKIENY